MKDLVVIESKGELLDLPPSPLPKKIMPKNK